MRAATTRELDATFSALADPTRRKVIDLLRARPWRAGELADQIAVSPPALSRHLRVLRQCGLVDGDGVDDDARHKVYRLRPERFAELRRWLDEIEGFWIDQLGAFAAHVEKKKGRRT
jgi:DNA-binding transcriptional ArsR family regulator